VSRLPSSDVVSVFRFLGLRNARPGLFQWLLSFSSLVFIYVTMSIQPLPLDVIAQIKSSTTITSLNGVVIELVKNSLDAESTKIDINVDYGRGGCVVEDDGQGILPTEFSENGGLGKLYRELMLPKPSNHSLTYAS
jgi:hypothetical protein